MRSNGEPSSTPCPPFLGDTRNAEGLRPSARPVAESVEAGLKPAAARWAALTPTEDTLFPRRRESRKEIRWACCGMGYLNRLIPHSWGGRDKVDWGIPQNPRQELLLQLLHTSSFIICTLESCPSARPYMNPRSLCFWAMASARASSAFRSSAFGSPLQYTGGKTSTLRLGIIALSCSTALLPHP